MAAGKIDEAEKAAESLDDKDKDKNLVLGQIAFQKYAEATAKAAGNADPKLTADGAKAAIDKLTAAKTPEALFQSARSTS